MNLQDILNLILSLFSKQDAPASVTPVVSQKKQIFLTRNDISSKGIFGTITLSWDSWSGVSLENFNLVIPAGTFAMEWHVSPHLGGATVPMLIAVPGRTEVLIHWGNTEDCSEGCILCGLVRDGEDIDSTQEACKELYAKINEVGIENVEIIIK